LAHVPYSPENVSAYAKTFTTFAGADIVAVFGKRIIGEIQSITYSVKREIAPVFVLGDANPKSFSRGKRGIAGSLVFTMFDREPLMSEMVGDWGNSTISTEYGQIWTALGNLNEGALSVGADVTLYNNLSYAGIDAWNQRMNVDIANDAYKSDFYGTKSGFGPGGLLYADQILPFSINIFLKNEFGQAAIMNIIGVQIINEGTGVSVDDITTEKAYSFVARDVWPLRKINTDTSSAG